MSPLEFLSVAEQALSGPQESLFAATLANLSVALSLALCAWIIGRRGRSPAWAHGLFLLALIKLVTPPLFPIEVELPLPTRPSAAVEVEQPSEEPAVTKALGPMPEAPSWSGLASAWELLDAFDAPLEPSSAPSPIALAPEEARASETTAVPWRALLLGIWTLGALLSWALAAQRIAFVRRLVRLSSRAPRNVQRETQRLARRLGLRRVPEVCIVPARLAPMLWAPGRRARIVLPAELFARLDRNARRALLAHELAHFHRRDHLVRWVELLVLGLHWWNPLAHACVRGLRAAEESCCDAWVVWALPGADREYAGLLVETAEYLGGAAAPLPLSAGVSSPARELQRRLTMILHAGNARTLTRRGRIALATVGLAALPFLPALSQEPEPQAAKERADALLQQTDLTKRQQIEWQEHINRAIAERAVAGYRPAQAEYELQKLELEDLKKQQIRNEALRAMTLDQVFARAKRERAAAAEQSAVRLRALKLGAEALLQQGMTEEARTLLTLADEMTAAAGGSASDEYARAVDRYRLNAEMNRQLSELGYVRSSEEVAPAEVDRVQSVLIDPRAVSEEQRQAEQPRNGERIDRIGQRLDELTRMIEKLANGFERGRDGLPTGGGDR